MSTGLAIRVFVRAIRPCYGPFVPDDERTRRRVGDETKERIADLASGWGRPKPEPIPAAAGTPEPRKKPPTGDGAIVEAAKTDAPSGTARVKAASIPPPIP